MAGCGLALLRLCLYKPLSLVGAGRLGAGRLEQVARELPADAVFLPGTRVRALLGRSYHVQRLEKSTVVHFGYQASPFPNDSGLHDPARAEIQGGDGHDYRERASVYRRPRW